LTGSRQIGIADFHRHHVVGRIDRAVEKNHPGPVRAGREEMTMFRISATALFDAAPLTGTVSNGNEKKTTAPPDCPHRFSDGSSRTVCRTPIRM